MKLSVYLKDRFSLFLSQLLLILCFSFVLSMTHLSAVIVFLLDMTAVLIPVLWVAVDYHKRNQFYTHLYEVLDHITDKTYLSSMLDTPEFAEAILLSDVLQQTTKSMNDQLAAYQAKNREYQEYIEAWIHEIKVPISCISLLCDNHKGEFTDSIRTENTRIEGYVEQALYYARSTNVEKDYMIKTLSLQTVVNSAIRKRSRELIGAHTQIRTDQLPDCSVYADDKWLDFILGQIISNSIKYRKENLTLTFTAHEKDNVVIFTVSDNGVGISEADLPRVTAKGFTGINGRKFAKSTGIGLYLCDQLCSKMHLKLDISSVEGEGTDVSIHFPKDKLVLLKD